MSTPQATAAQQVAFIEKRLLALFIAKHDAETTVANSDKEILSLRNVLSGMPIGQQLAAEITAEQNATAKLATTLPVPPIESTSGSKVLRLYGDAAHSQD